MNDDQTSTSPAIRQLCWRGGDGEHTLVSTVQQNTALEQGKALESRTTAPSIRGCLQVSGASAASTGPAGTVPKQQPLAHKVL